MGKVEFRSHMVELSVPVEKAFTFLVDLNNLQKLMPEQVINWKSTDSTCEFDIKGMAHVTLQRIETVENKLIRIISGPETPLSLEITGNLDKISEVKTAAFVGLTADLSPMLQLMVSGPFQNLVNIMADKLGSEF